MAHHHHGRYDQKHGTPGVVTMPSRPASANLALPLEEELGADVDEPPDEIRWGQLTPRGSSVRADQAEFSRIAPAQVDRKRSLLSQALAPSPEARTPEPIQPPSRTVHLSREASEASSGGYISAASTADLTSDGGLTSPARTNTPSPPLPEANCVVAWDPHSKALCRPRLNMQDSREELVPIPTTQQVAMSTAALTMEQPVPERKRCIKFACDRKAPIKSDEIKKEDAPKMTDATSHDPPKRPCALRFACPFKSAESTTKPTSRPVESARTQSTPVPTSRARPASSAAQPAGPAEPEEATQPDRDPPRTVPQRTRSTDRAAERARVEASRFHEFASSLEEEDEWMTEDATQGCRLTVDDTLKKEKKIRAIGEEAEEEANQEDEERERDVGSDDESDDGEDAPEVDDRDEDEEEVISDDGAESDDEQGFASSDDEDDADSQYSFWTLRRSTAATSVEPVGQADQHHHPAESKPLAGPRIEGTSPRHPDVTRLTRAKHRHLGVDIRSDTPTLPDSTDFVCGTLDEDRPMEEAYVSCMAERERSSHQIIPQDIDPSFPTSDLEDENGVSDREEGDRSPTKRQLEESSDGSRRSREGRKMSQPKRARVPSPPRRLHSPPPLRRSKLPRSPPPRRHADTSPKRPALTSHHESSTNVSPTDRNCHHLPPPSRPPLMRIKSLPRAPNPFYQQCTNLHRDGEGGNTSPTGRKMRKGTHRRGAIDIVSGLEAKRQRWREKAWLKYCQRTAKCKERKPLPGEGAERMRELGLEMAGKCRGPTGRAQYMLSI